MKTYHEMTESVLQRAQAETVAQKRRRRNGIAIAASGVCLALVLTVIGVGLKQTPTVVPTLPSEMLMNPEDTTVTSQPAEQQVMVTVTYLSDIEGQVSQEKVSPYVPTPLDGRIWIRDIRGLTKEEVDQVRQEVMAAVSEFRLPVDGLNTMYETPGVIAACATNGIILLDLSNSPAVKSIDHESTDMGRVDRVDFAKDYRVETSFAWSISGYLVDALHHDPTIPLESIRDTVTITINYENGTTETLVFDITVDEEGQIFVTQRGIPTIAA